MSTRYFNPSDYKQLIKHILTPNEIHASVLDVNYEKLLESGLDTLIVDIDNTLVTYEQRNVGLDNERLIGQLKDMGFKIYILSNNSSKKRIDRIAQQLTIPGQYFALKPFTFGIKELIHSYNININKSIVMGDQVLKDIAVGNWMNMYTILVNPINIRKSLLKTVQRQFELNLLNKIENW